MSELISGKEAFDAAYNGDAAQWRWTGKEVEWRELKGETAFSINELKDGVCEFRLKPRTITLNGIDVPAPFDPKEDEGIWVLSDMHNNGYMRSKHKDNFGYAFGAWRTEDEIKQVVVALRSVFNVK